MRVLAGCLSLFAITTLIGVGWIVFKSPNVDNQGAAITPAPAN